MDYASTLAAAEALPREERIRLVQDIWDSIAAEQTPPEISPELAAELERRIAAYEANPQDVKTWEEIESSLRKPS